MTIKYQDLKNRYLKDPEVRAEYDRLGPEFESYGGVPQEAVDSYKRGKKILNDLEAHGTFIVSNAPRR